MQRAALGAFMMSFSWEEIAPNWSVGKEIRFLFQLASGNLGKCGMLFLQYFKWLLTVDNFFLFLSVSVLTFKAKYQLMDVNIFFIQAPHVKTKVLPFI